MIARSCRSIALATAVGTALAACAPSDAELEANFKTHKAQLDQLKNIIQNQKLEFVNERGFTPELDQEQQAETRELMNAVGARQVSVANGTIKLTTYTFGLAVSGVYRGYYYEPDGGVLAEPGQRVVVEKGYVLRLDENWFSYRR